jgi:hypothetical protein
MKALKYCVIVVVALLAIFALRALWIIHEQHTIESVFSRAQFIAKDRRLKPFQKYQALENMDTSACPRDFQMTWLAYAQEKEENAKIKNNTGGKLAVETLVAVSSAGLALPMLGEAAKTVADAPEQSDVAWFQLQRVCLEYGLHIHR